MKRLVVLAALILNSFLPVTGQELKTKNVVIITLDGFRWREVFSGADSRLIEHDTAALRAFGAESRYDRREKLLPFFWNVIAKHGQLYGNRRHGNKVNLTNPNFYSYSGYSEMFVGFVDPRIRDNTPNINRNLNIFHTVNRHPEFANDVAVFSTWEVMDEILRARETGIYTNTGGEKASGRHITKKEHTLNKLTETVVNPLGKRYDRFTFQYAMEYLKRERPRVLYISFDETDENAHAGRYLPYLNAAQQADEMIGQLWAWLQSQEQYRDKTTLIITTDHGRGRSTKSWKHHRILFRGSGQTWLAVLGPDTPSTGEMKTRGTIEQRQLAKTVGAFLGIDYVNVKPVGEVITSMFKHGEVTQDQKVLSYNPKPEKERD